LISGFASTAISSGKASEDKVMQLEANAKDNEQGRGGNGPFFTLFIDGTEYHVSEPTITGREVMALGGIAPEVGLILLLEDGTQQVVRPDDVIELKPGRRFKKAPRFNRG